MSAAHTPGPWTVSPSGQTIWADFPHDDPNTGFRCSVGREVAKVTRDDATDIANAALIAKAPIAPKLADALRLIAHDTTGVLRAREIAAAALAEWDAQ